MKHSLNHLGRQVLETSPGFLLPMVAEESRKMNFWALERSFVIAMKSTRFKGALRKRIGNVQITAGSIERKAKLGQTSLYGQSSSTFQYP